MNQGLVHEVRSKSVQYREIENYPQFSAIGGECSDDSSPRLINSAADTSTRIVTVDRLRNGDASTDFAEVRDPWNFAFPVVLRDLTGVLSLRLVIGSL